MSVQQLSRSTESIIRTAARWVSLAAGLTLFAMMMVTVIDVATRFAGRPLLGFFEVTSLLLVCLVFLGLAQTQAIKGNVNVEVFVARLPVRLRGLIDLFINLCCLGLSALMGYQSWLQSLDILANHQVTGTLFIPYYPFYLIVVFGFLLLSLVFVVDIAHSVGRLVKP